jgi:hypothetical protein
MGGRDANPEWDKIPRAELEKLDSVLEDEDREFRFVKWLDGGYSGSPVALIRDTVSGKSSVERILKFCSRGNPEAQGIDRAYELAPDEFKERHLVRVNRQFPLNDWCGVLMEIAGGDLSFPSLAEYEDDDKLAEICANLIGSVLREWNSGERELSEDLRVGKFLRRVVGENKMKPDGAIFRFADRAGIALSEDWIQRAGWDRWLRNPLVMLSDDYGQEISAIVGIGHGDLSIFNVLIPETSDPQVFGYWMIDYGTSGASHPLTRDPMYLLLSLATRWLRDYTASSDLRRSLISLLAMESGNVAPIRIAPYKKVYSEVIKAGYEWAAQKHRGHYWRSQSQLSMIGCALTFIGRKIDSLEISETDDWLFDLAAVAATEYCKVNEKRATPPRPPMQALPAPNGSVPRLIEELGRVTFGGGHWTQLELGTRDLRALLMENYEINTSLAASIYGLIAELRSILEGAISPLASQPQISVASRRAEEIRERLVTLLRS